jgi:type VI secretion system protein ImpM
MPEEAVNVDVAPGWFGKVPSLGDFASRRLPAGFVQPWDGWLQRGLLAARAELGERRWLDTYLVAPVLRFWLAPGVVGVPGWAGLMMPSVDRVGRHFPLTIAHAGVSLAATLAARDWFDALDRAARSVLDVSCTADDFEQALGALPGDGPARTDEGSEVLATRLHGTPTPASVWWCGDAGERTAFRTFAGLPPESAFAALLGAAS